MTNWETCVQFHGHACGGLTIGYKAACYAAELLELSFSGDEQVVCIAENDACGVDAIQALLGCSIGKGNLLFHMRGKQAFSFYNRATGKSVRLVLRPRPEGMTREESFAYYQAQEPADLFDVKPATIPLPEKAKKARVIPEIADVPPKKASQTAKKPQPLPEKSAGKANSISIG